MVGKNQTPMKNSAFPTERELLKAVLQISPVGLGFVKNRILLWANPAMEQMLGYGQNELTEKSAAILYHSPEEFDRVGLELYAMMKEDGIAKINTQWVRKDGGVFECCLQACPLNKKDPLNGCTVASAVDESLRLKTEADFEREQERFKILVEESPLGIAIIDSSGRYEYINPEFTHIFGYTLADIPTGTAWFEKVFPDPGYRQEVISAWFEDLCRATANSDRHRTFQVTCKTGKEKIVFFRPVTMTTGKQFVICLDITEQKHLESQLLRAQKMEAMGTLASGVAHDFNNILGAILGYAELAQLKVPPDQQELQYSLENILKAGHRAKDLVKQILAFSRRSDQEMKPVKISLIMTEVLKLLRATLSTAIAIRQQMNAPDDLVFADPTKIHQLLMNLCTNAHHAMAEKGGVLELALDRKHIDSQTTADFPELCPGAHLCLTLRDTGCGIPPEVRNRIFDPYFTTKGKDLGTGLGLAVVHSIVHSHRGAIRVKSEPGMGSEFSIFLPIFHGKNPTAELPPGQLPRGSERILFVDDEDALADLGKRILEHLGYSVNVQTSSIDALDAFRASPHAFSLVITDMAMPHLSGDQLAQKLLEIRPDLPIILCTGYSEWISAETAQKKGFCDFVMKPLVMHEIASTIRKHLDK